MYRVDPAIFASEHSNLMAPFRSPSSILAETDAVSFASGSLEGRRVGLVLVAEILLASFKGESYYYLIIFNL